MRKALLVENCGDAPLVKGVLPGVQERDRRRCDALQDQRAGGTSQSLLVESLQHAPIGAEGAL